MEDRRLSVVLSDSEPLHVLESADPDIRLELGMFYIDSEIAELRRNASRPLTGPNLIDRVDSISKKLCRRKHK